VRLGGSERLREAVTRTDEDDEGAYAVAEKKATFRRGYGTYVVGPRVVARRAVVRESAMRPHSLRYALLSP
jgi:hypothetical protein